MGKQNAGREGVQFEIRGDGLRLYYAPQTQAMIGRKVDGRMEMEVHRVGPPDGCMARIFIRGFDPVEFFLDRECVPILDRGGPWTRETRGLEDLNIYLSLFGLKMKEPKEEDEDLEVEIVEPKEPQDFCDHETDFYLLEVMDVQFVGGVGYSIEAEVPCGLCGIKKGIKFTIPEDADNWDDEDEEG
jgi:hypothetical protein